MYIESLSVTNFRNLTAVELEPATGVNIFYGDNGSGKTNLLEAIFILSLGRSQRGARERDMVAREVDTYRVAGRIHDGDTLVDVAVACQRSGRKRVTLDEVGAKTSELFSRFCAVSLGPEDTEIVSGAPSRRRSFLDIYLSQMSRRYLLHLVDYQKTLAQKNAALKAEQDCSPFDALLVAVGAEIIAAREEFIEQISREAAGFYERISDGGQLKLVYDSSVDLSTVDATAAEIAGVFNSQLTTIAAREAAAGLALLGPHRDDIGIEIDDLPARTCGSQGEWRSAAIALKLAVYKMLSERRGTPPVLLLDELFAELDPGRVRQLISCFGQLGQLFLTTAGVPPAELQDNSRRFRISAGDIQEVA